MNEFEFCEGFFGGGGTFQLSTYVNRVRNSFVRSIKAISIGYVASPEAIKFYTTYMYKFFLLLSNVELIMMSV